MDSKKFSNYSVVSSQSSKIRITSRFKYSSSGIQYTTIICPKYGTSGSVRRGLTSLLRYIRAAALFGKGQMSQHGISGPFSVAVTNRLEYFPVVPEK